MRRGLPAILIVALASCGVQQAVPQAHRAAQTTSGRSVVPSLPVGHPQAVEPVAGDAPAAAAGPAPTGPAVVSVGGNTGNLPQPVSDATIRQELAQSGMTGNAGQAKLTPNGLAIPPADAPPVVQEIIQAGNEIAHLPYVWGGGHARYEDTGYDCSGSISFVFETAGLLSSPVVSGDLMTMGDPGRGRWVTVFANAGHTFMYVAGLRFDTVALAETGSRWSNRPASEGDASFSVRHPPGL